MAGNWASPGRRSWPSLGRFWPACLLAVLLLLPAPTLPAIEISESELAQLEVDLLELETQSQEQQRILSGLLTQLFHSEVALSEAQKSLQETKKFLSEYTTATETEIHRARAERDAWRVTAVATGVVGLAAVIVVLLLH